nr:hypothetical protein Iba_chr06bCG11850 [Ipomoea batatas]
MFSSGDSGGFVKILAALFWSPTTASSTPIPPRFGDWVYRACSCTKLTLVALSLDLGCSVVFFAFKHGISRAGFKVSCRVVHCLALMPHGALLSSGRLVPSSPLVSPVPSRNKHSRTEVAFVIILWLLRQPVPCEPSVSA